LFRFLSNVEEADLRNRKRTYEALRRLPEAYWSRRVQTMGGPLFLFQSSLAELLQRAPAGKPNS
jgi:hypothetical protein